MQTHLTLILKPVGFACNLSCTYCENEDGCSGTRRSEKPMTLLFAQHLFEQIKMLGSIGIKEIKLIWHGGEPTLSPISFYREVCKIQSTVLSNGNIKVINTMQTNGMELDEEWIEFFKETGWKPGISIDGPEHIHDANRLTHDGKGSFSTIMKNVSSLLQKLPKVGFNAVVSSQSVGQSVELFEFLSKNFDTFDISPCYNPAGSKTTLPFAITPEEFAQLFCEMFDLWWYLDNPKIKIRTFSAVIQAVLGNKPRLCSMSNGCAGFLAVENDGSVYPCGRMGGFEELLLGNINDQTLVKILQGPERKQYLDKILSLPEKCISCEWVGGCHNGCPMHRYLGVGEFTKMTIACEANIQIFEHVKVRVTETQIFKNKKREF